MSRWNLTWLIGLPGIVLLTLAVSASAPPPSQDYRLVRTIVDVLAEVDKHYVRELTEADKKRLVEEMINGGLEKLDPHSQYFNEQELQQFESNSDGQFGGIGIVLQADPKSGFLKIESPMPGTPAYEAGVQAGELILKVDGKSTEGMTVDDARGIIKGHAGTKVTLMLQPEGSKDSREVVLTRANIELHPVLGYMRRADDPKLWDFMVDKQNKIALVRVITFNEKTTDEIRAAVREAEQAGAKGLIIDLRDDPGGLLDQAIKVADLFLNDGIIVSTKDRQGGVKSRMAEKAGTIFEPAAQRPIVVLVNRMSASASEIVASALQDHGRAIVIGERSYGKGSVQKVFPLKVTNVPSGAVKLTSEVWLTPKGKNIHRWPDSKETDEWGVRPNEGFDVKLTDDDRRQYLLHMRSLEMVKGKPGTGPVVNPAVPVAAPAAVTPYKDPVVEKALEYLRGKIQEAGNAGRFEGFRRAA